MDQHLKSHIQQTKQVPLIVSTTMGNLFPLPSSLSIQSSSRYVFIHDEISVEIWFSEDKNTPTAQFFRQITSSCTMNARILKIDKEGIFHLHVRPDDCIIGTGNGREHEILRSEWISSTQGKKIISLSQHLT